MTDSIVDTILAQVRRIAGENGGSAPAALTRETEVFESGLDSLGFAILVADLEERFGFDPFVALADPIYPQTLGEFIDLYERHAATATATP